MFKNVTDFYKWIPIPPIGTFELGRFIGRCIRTTQYLSKYTTAVVFDADMKTATADTDTNTITLPLWPLSEEGWRIMFDPLPTKQLKEACVAVYNGLVAHESLHLIHSHSIKTVKATLGTSATLWECFNIMEDQYIETTGKAESPFADFMQNLNDLFFPETKIRTMYRELQNAPEGAQAAPILNLLAAYTNQRLQHLPLWEHVPYIHLAQQASVAHDPQERIKYAIELYKGLFVENHNIEPNLEDLESNKSLSSDQRQQMIGRQNREGDEGLLIETATRDLTRQGGPNYANDVLDKNITTVSCGVFLQPDTRFKGFGRTLAKLKIKHNSPHQPLESGITVLPSALYRVATDYRMLGNPTQNTREEAPEFIGLIDASGSMVRRNLLINVTRAAQACAEELREARIKFSFYAHTSTTGEQPVLYHIASHGMRENTIDLADRFLRVSHIACNNNYDGYVIEHTAQKFTRRKNRKIMMVLSDGVPLGRGYSGPPAAAHTRGVVEKLRARGIIVIALSLVKDVMHANNLIYGSEWNIRATRNVADELFEIVKSFL